MSAIVTMGCVSVPAYLPIGEPILRGNGLEIVIDNDRMKPAAFGNEFFIAVTVKNTRDADVVFDSGALELFEPKSGLSFYSFSKDKETISVPDYRKDVITKTTIGPKRAIQGRIVFVTGNSQIKSDDVEIRFGSQTMKLKKN